MSDYGKQFFEGKRPWSRIKDSILRSYMRPYLTKVSSKGNPIVLIDGFAGPGVYGKEHKSGSPLILEGLASKIAPNSHRTYFINNKKSHHRNLSAILEKANWNSAKAILGTAQEKIPTLLKDLGNETLFLYLDPFGPSVCPFSIIEPLLHRRYSTELLIVFHAPALHRLAARHRVASSDIDTQIQHNHEILTTTMGGDYWQPILWDPNLSRKDRELRVVNAYCERISEGNLKFTGYCPVQRTRNSAAKYYVVFATSHIDGLKLMNDEMIRSFESYITEKEFEDTLFAGESWENWRNPKDLSDLALQLIKNNPGQPRENYWHTILSKSFFRYTEKEFRTVIKDLIDQKIIKFESITKKLGDRANLYPINYQQQLL